MKYHNVEISPHAHVGEGLKIGNGSVIEKEVCVGRHVTIGRNVLVKKGVHLADGSILEDNVIVGYQTLTGVYDKRAETRKTVIGGGVVVRPNTVVYTGCHVGEASVLNHNVVIREATLIGRHTSIGCLVKSEGYLSIGSHCSIHALCSLTPFMEIGDYVFMGPGTISLNDAVIDFGRKIETVKRGPRIKYGARIGGNVTLCPGVVIGKEAFVSAGSLVVRDVPDFCKVAGMPAKILGRVKKARKMRPSTVEKSI